MTAALNIPKLLEASLHAALIEAGVDETTCFVNFLQIRTAGEARYPQIQGAIASPVPEGMQGTKFSEFRRAAAMLRLATTTDADPFCETFGTVYVQVMTMFESMVASPQTWQNANHAGVIVNSVDLQQGTPVMPEQMAGGGYRYVAEIPFELVISVT